MANKGGALANIGQALSGYGSALSGNPMFLQNSLIMRQMQDQRRQQEQEQRQNQVGNAAAMSFLRTQGMEGTPATKQFQVNGKTYGQNAPATKMGDPLSMFSKFAGGGTPLQSIAAQRAIGQLFPQQKAPVVGKPGDVILDPNNDYSVLASVPAAPKEFEPTNMQKPGTDLVVMARTPQEFDAYSQRGFVKSGTSIPGAKSPEKPKDPFDSAKALRSEFFDANKEFVKIRDSYGRIISSAREPSAAGDLALIFNFMKMLDPGSTVREGEFANAQNAGGVNDRTRAWYNNVLRGERLTEAQRSDFLSKSTGIFNTQKSFYDETVKRYSNLAERSSIPAADVVYDMTAGLPSLGVAAPQAGGSALASDPNIPRPQTQSDFDSLPRGSVYIDPDDGKQYRKM